MITGSIMERRLTRMKKVPVLPTSERLALRLKMSTTTSRERPTLRSRLLSPSKWAPVDCSSAICLMRSTSSSGWDGLLLIELLPKLIEFAVGHTEALGVFGVFRLAVLTVFGRHRPRVREDRKSVV